MTLPTVEPTTVGFFYARLKSEDGRDGIGFDSRGEVVEAP